MAKKKRGRPPGSTNKKSIGKSVATMDVSQLRAHIDSLQSVLAKKSASNGLISKTSSPARRLRFKESLSGGQGRHAGKRAKAKPKYQSKKTKA